MGRTSIKCNAKAAKKRTRSKGTLGHGTTVAIRAKLNNAIKCYDKEFQLCKTFIIKNLKIREIVDGQVRRLITTRERMFRLFEKWRDELDDRQKQLANLNAVRNVVLVELHDLGDDHDPDEIADREEEIADLNVEIEDIVQHDAEVERDIRLIKMIFKDVERSLLTHKTEHETIHTRLCQKLAFIRGSRQWAIAHSKGFGITKNRKNRI